MVLVVVAGASLTVALAALPWADPFAAGSAELGKLATVGLLQIAFADAVFLCGAKSMAPTRAALLTLLEVPLAPLLVWLAKGEAPSATTAVGGAIVLSAVTANILVEGRQPLRGSLEAEAI